MMFLKPSSDSGLAETASMSCDHVLVPHRMMASLPASRMTVAMRLQYVYRSFEEPSYQLVPVGSLQISKITLS